MSTFDFEPSVYVPFRDKKEIARCRQIKRSEIDQHPNPDFQIRVLADKEMPYSFMTDMFERIVRARDEGRSLAMLMPNPNGLYPQIARLINAARVDCKHVHLFALDEYADQDGNVAPEDWPYGFMNSMLSRLYANIDQDLRMPRSQVHGPNNDNIDHYYDLMQEAGGIDMSYSGPGWAGHVGFVEPDAPEFDAPLEEWKQMGARICTLSPFTIAQNSLHGSFGKSGDLSAVPPKAATIGPKEIIAARHRRESAGIGVHGTSTSWQRLTARLCYHGPVSPKLPTSIHQELRTDCYISETVAADIEPDWDKAY